MSFFKRTGLERVGVVRPEPGPMLGWSISSGCGYSLQKEQEIRRVGRGFARNRSDAYVSFFMKEKIDCLEGEYVAYLSPMGWPGIYSVCFYQLDGDKDSLVWGFFSLSLSD